MFFSRFQLYPRACVRIWTLRPCLNFKIGKKEIAVNVYAR